jgi:predicted XRE-type DNA-binding protein
MILIIDGAARARDTYLVTDSLSPASARPSLRIRGDTLRRELAARGLDQRGLAKLAGITESTVSHAMNGHTLHAQTVSRIALALERVPRLPGVAELLE